MITSKSLYLGITQNCPTNNIAQDLITIYLTNKLYILTPELLDIGLVFHLFLYNGLHT